MLVVVGRAWSVVGCCLLVCLWLVLVVYGSLFVVCCSLVVAWCVFDVLCCLLFV